MTQAMRQVAKTISVKRLTQSWQFPSTAEAQYLGLNPDYYALIREVYLLGDGVVWAFARTVFPYQLFSGRYQYLLRELNDRPIGDLLYSQPGVCRQRLEIAKFDVDCPEVRAAQIGPLDQPTPLWGRRAQFQVFNSCLSVSEILLPEIASYVEK